MPTGEIPQLGPVYVNTAMMARLLSVSIHSIRMEIRTQRLPAVKTSQGYRIRLTDGAARIGVSAETFRQLCFDVLVDLGLATSD